MHRALSCCPSPPSQRGGVRGTGTGGPLNRTRVHGGAMLRTACCCARGPWLAASLRPPPVARGGWVQPSRAFTQWRPSQWREQADVIAMIAILSKVMPPPNYHFSLARPSSCCGTSSASQCPVTASLDHDRNPGSRCTLPQWRTTSVQLEYSRCHPCAAALQSAR